MDVSSSPRSERTGPTCLVLCPTRELALQIQEETKKINYKGIKRSAPLFILWDGGSCHWKSRGMHLKSDCCILVGSNWILFSIVWKMDLLDDGSSVAKTLNAHIFPVGLTVESLKNIYIKRNQMFCIFFLLFFKLWLLIYFLMGKRIYKEKVPNVVQFFVCLFFSFYFYFLIKSGKKKLAKVLYNKTVFIIHALFFCHP